MSTRTMPPQAMCVAQGEGLMLQSRFLVLGMATVAAVAAPVAADVVDTFTNNVNLGAWRLTTNPNMLYQIEPTGGNPGAYLHGQVSTAVPTWYIDVPSGNPYTGDFAAEGIQSFKFDMT